MIVRLAGLSAAPRLQTDKMPGRRGKVRREQEGRAPDPGLVSREDTMRFNRTLARSALLAMLALPACADSTQGIADKTINISNLGPFSGESAVFNPLNYGPEAYLRYINAQGGVHGRKFETIFADDACNEAKAPIIRRSSRS